MTQIPLYRAKKADSNEWVEGYYLPHTMWDGYHYIVEGFDEYTCGHPCGETNAIVNETRIDLSTLSIHLPNMLDKNNNKIFASLSEDGRGGDILKDLNSWYIIYDNKNGCFIGKEISSINLKLNLHYWNFKDCTIIGIKQ